MEVFALCAETRRYYLFDFENDGVIDHVGIVESVSGGYVIR